MSTSATANRERRLVGDLVLSRVTGPLDREQRGARVLCKARPAAMTALGDLFVTGSSHEQLA